MPKYTKEEEAGGSLSKKQAIGKATGRFCTRSGAILDVQTTVAVQDPIEGMDENLSILLQGQLVLALMTSSFV